MRPSLEGATGALIQAFDSMAYAVLRVVPVVHRRDPRGLRSAPPHADAAGRAGGACGPTGATVASVVKASQVLFGDFRRFWL
jgi:hypothetical protein